MKIDYPVVGIDVSKTFSFYAVMAPDGVTWWGKPFKLSNGPRGLVQALETFKKIEEAFGSKPAVVLESTGHYSKRLVQYFTRKGFKTFLVNPLRSHSIKTSSIRKVKTDRLDCEELARLPFIMDLSEYQPQDEDMANLQYLCRAMHHLAEQRVTILNQFVAILDQVWPGFTEAFPDPGSRIALAFLKSYSSPASFLSAEKQEVLDLFMAYAKRRGGKSAEKRYEILYRIATEDASASIQMDALYICINTYSGILINLNSEIARLEKAINELAERIPAVGLLKTIPGIGNNLAAMIAGEIGDISRFKNARQLVAYCGIDPSVKQSGNFTGSRNRLSKRGSPYIRKALYIAATVAVRKNANGECVNPVLRNYYEQKIVCKPKKQALGAIMNKLVRIIFAVLKNQKPFKLITPEEQKALHSQKLTMAA